MSRNQLKDSKAIDINELVKNTSSISLLLKVVVEETINACREEELIYLRRVRDE